MQYADATDKKHDVDVIEAQVDDVIRSVLQHVYSTSTLSEQVRSSSSLLFDTCAMHGSTWHPACYAGQVPCWLRAASIHADATGCCMGMQDLSRELQSLEDGVNQTQGTADAAILSLALNSMQRLHAAQIKTEESEDEQDMVGSAHAHVPYSLCRAKLMFASLGVLPTQPLSMPVATVAAKTAQPLSMLSCECTSLAATRLSCCRRRRKKSRKMMTMMTPSSCHCPLLSRWQMRASSGCWPSPLAHHSQSSS